MSSASRPAWQVLKFGGTSVTGLAAWQRLQQHVAQCLESRPDSHVLVVCSALAGMTNQLEQLAVTLDGDQRQRLVAELLSRCRAQAGELGVDADDLLEALEAACSEQHALAAADETSAPRRAAVLAALLGMGEWVSAQLGARYLAGQGLDAAWLDAREALQSEASDDPRIHYLEASCLPQEDPAMGQQWADRARVLLTQGFVAADPAGAPVLLGRGGSDTSAACFGALLGADEVCIFTDVEGIMSADPRIVDGAHCLPALDYDEALEIAGAGAGVIHPRAIQVAARGHLPLRVLKAGASPSSGTLIRTPERRQEAEFKAVTVRGDMLALLLQNRDIRRSVGFLAWVFDCFGRRGLSIDQVATSEVTTTVVLDRATNRLDGKLLDELIAELASRCRVTLHPDCACVSLVGHWVSRLLPEVQGAMGLFRSVPLYLASCSANNIAYTLVVPRASSVPLVQALHQALHSGAPPLETVPDKGVSMS